jgi:hypothetical protein
MLNLIRFRRGGTPVLPGSISALIFLAFLLSFLRGLSSDVEKPQPQPGVEALQPIGGEEDSPNPDVATPSRQSPKVSTPKPLIIQQALVSEDGPQLSGTVEPVKARCVMQIGGCRLDLEFKNWTNGWVNSVAIYYEMSRGGRLIKEGYINGTPELLAPTEGRTVSDRVDDISLDQYELEFCVVLFNWFANRSADGQLTPSYSCRSATFHAQN